VRICLPIISWKEKYCVGYITYFTAGLTVQLLLSRTEGLGVFVVVVVTACKTVGFVKKFCPDLIFFLISSMFLGFNHSNF
jgi:hypothetical protein